MPRVVGVRFKPVGKVYYFDPVDFEYSVGAKVVVETARGIEYGDVCIAPREVPEDQVVQPLKRVVRVGTDHDAQVVDENRRRQKDAFPIVRDKIATHSLDMHLCDVEYSFDRSKVIFYFTAEGRIDFRELVKDLASIFRTRIEMRQIGVRDEAKLIGGIGPCGRILCCSSFLGEFSPVSIRMAKDQNLSLNPTKISGVCGRLMCCLRYEQETYEAAKKDPTLAPGYAPPPQEKVEEYLKEYQEEETGGTRFYGLPEKPRSEAPQARISSAPQRQPSPPAPPRPGGQREAAPAGESRRQQTGQGFGQARPQGQGGRTQPARGQAQPQPQGGQAQRSQGQTTQPGQQRGPGQPKPQGTAQPGQPARGQGGQPKPQAQPPRPPQPQPAQTGATQPPQTGATQPAQLGETGEHRRRRRRRHRGRGHGTGPDGQGGPPPAPAPQ